MKDQVRKDPMPQSRRGLARRLTVQALYSWLFNETPPERLLKQFREDPGLGRADAEYFQALLDGTVREAPQLLTHFTPHLDRPVHELDPMERAILMVGTYELVFCPDVPWRVVVNESVNLAKMFGGVDESFKFVNGVLDKVARSTRSVEVSAGL
ncbi:MAG: transcription antitermination factor NusB [Pseudomonadota bacterium]|uniref:Transcription antitermination protein NusB n=1 Tax=Banduia mediterranea TaxID=3075609 RepID=A0ABU2WMV8_9GAMM|nr:transcription antitermination factor NusB [Algiphilus sp. W345]MDT0498865.1 transcription antitermination factor NusB [Algiphilus sp. W345]MEC9358774.1 transcription antitermination factor NusB [Pseudomonadota bacterium]